VHLPAGIALGGIVDGAALVHAELQQQSLRRHPRERHVEHLALVHEADSLRHLLADIGDGIGQRDALNLAQGMEDEKVADELKLVEKGLDRVLQLEIGHVHRVVQTLS
jgi:hypothetical protein